MNEYAPGTVAVATVRGVEGVRVMRGHLAGELGWLHDGDIADRRLCGATVTWDDEVTDIRPLVVLDLDLSAAHTFAGWLRGHTVPGFRTTGADIADQIEAQTKPPRIPEPGLWGVVEANSPLGFSRVWYRATDDRWWPSACIGNERSRRWDELEDPVLIREGVES